MLIARVIILLVLTGLQVYFCYMAGKWVTIPAEMWTIGLLCGGNGAIDVLHRIQFGKEVKTDAI